MFELIPETKQAAVAQGLRASFGSVALDGLEPVRGGLSSALVYRMTIKGRCYLLRMVMKVDAINDPARHFACMTAAANAGLAPAVHYTSAADGLSITDFVAGRPLAALERPRPALLADLATAVRRLQALAPFPPLVDYLDGVAQLIARVRASDLLPASGHPAFERCAEIAAVYPRVPEDQVASHNDINPNNCLWDGQRIWIVDWEAAFRNDRYVDPAYICNFFTGSPEEELGFLTAYFAAPPTDIQKARIFLMRQVCQTFFGAILLQTAAAARPELRLLAEAFVTPPLPELRPRTALLLQTPEGQIHLALAVLNQVEASAQSAGFTEALHMVDRFADAGPGSV